MNEKIGVIIDFLTPAYEKTLRDSAALDEGKKTMS